MTEKTQEQTPPGLTGLTFVAGWNFEKVVGALEERGILHTINDPPRILNKYDQPYYRGSQITVDSDDEEKVRDILCPDFRRTMYNRLRCYGFYEMGEDFHIRSLSGILKFDKGRLMEVVEIRVWV
jgi:hypothetical protein